MALVDWSHELPDSDDDVVSYSTLAIPERRESIDDDIAQLRIDNLVIDVEWDDDEQEYNVTMFEDEYENQRAQVNVKTPSEVVAAVKSMVAHARRLIASSSGPQ